MIRRPRDQSPPLPLAGFVLGSPEFNSSVTLVNSQLHCLRTVGILKLVGHNENYWFTSNYVTPIKSFFVPMHRTDGGKALCGEEQNTVSSN